MFDQLRPPTDNLYKFIALAGLTAAIFAAYMNTTRDINVRAFYAESDDAWLTARPYFDRYYDEVDRIDDAVRAKRMEPAKAKAETDAAYKKMMAATEKLHNTFDDAKLEARKLAAKTWYQYLVLQIAGWTGGLLLKT